MEPRELDQPPSSRAPRVRPLRASHKTVVVAFGRGAFAVAGAPFLILDMNHPYRGRIHVSDAPIRDGLTILGK